MPHKIYINCMFCGKRKSPNTFEYCSNDCRRTRKELTNRFWDNKPKVELKISELLNKKPMVYHDLNDNLVKTFKSYRVSKWEIGKMLTSLITIGKLRIYPFKIVNRGISFCYIRSAQREEASNLYVEYLHSLPPGVRIKAYLDYLEIRKIAPKILSLWDKGCNAEQISKETNISVTRIKELIIKKR